MPTSSRATLLHSDAKQGQPCRYSSSAMASGSIRMSTCQRKVWMRAQVRGTTDRRKAPERPPQTLACDLSRGRGRGRWCSSHKPSPYMKLTLHHFRPIRQMISSFGDLTAPFVVYSSIVQSHFSGSVITSNIL